MNKKTGLWLAVLTQLAGCGGGSGGSGNGTPPVSQSSSIAATTYSISVSVTGLTGTGLVLQNNGANDLAIPANGTVTFATQIASGGAYNVTVKTQPTSQPEQVCDVVSGAGIVGAAAVVLSVSCRSPVGKFVYVADMTSSIGGFSVNATTGALAPIGGSPFPKTAGFGPIFTNKSGTNLYAIGVGSSGNVSLSSYSIQTSSGALVQLANSPIQWPGTSSGPVLLHPSGKFMYVSDSTSGKWYAYSVDPVSGQLAALSGSPFSIGASGGGAVFDSTGSRVFVTYANASSGMWTLAVYAVDAVSGQWTSLATYLFSGGFPGQPVLHPSGSYLYVLVGSTGKLAAFAIGSGGAVSSVAGSPFSVGTQPGGPVIHAAASYLYVINHTGNSSTGAMDEVSAYSINTASGQLTPVGSVSTGGLLGYGPLIHRDGNYLVVPNAASKNIAVFAIGSNGALTSTGTPFVPSGQVLGALVFEQSGKFAYLTDSVSGLMTAMRFDSTLGRFTLIGTYTTVSSVFAPTIAGSQ